MDFLYFLETTVDSMLSPKHIFGFSPFKLSPIGDKFIVDNVDNFVYKSILWQNQHFYPVDKL